MEFREKNFKELILLLMKKLVSSRSITGQELPAAMILNDFFNDYDMKGEVEIFDSSRANYYISINQDSPSPKLLFCSHIDVVPPGDENLWQSDPFEVIQKGETLIGRGVCDAMGSIVPMVLTLLLLHKDSNFTGNVAFLAVAGEEKGSVGAKRFIAEHGNFEGAVIIGEPTQGNVKNEQKGRLEFTLNLFGNASHAALPNDRNAILLAVEYLKEIIPLVYEVNENYMSTDNSCPSIAITNFETMNYSNNSIPGEVRIIFDRRWTIEEKPEEIIRKFTKLVEGVAIKQKLDYELHTRVGIPAAKSCDQSQIFRAAIKAREKVYGNSQLDSKVFMAGCDLHVFANKGFDTIICGPGDLIKNRAHGIDENISINELMDSIYLYREIVKRYFTGS